MPNVKKVVFYTFFSILNIAESETPKSKTSSGNVFTDIDIQGPPQQTVQL